MTVVAIALACYLGGCVIGTLIFVGIGSHICNRDKEFHEFITDVNAAHDRGEI